MHGLVLYPHRTVAFIREGPLHFVGVVDGCTDKSKVTDHTPFQANGALSKNETSFSRFFLSFDLVLVVPFEGSFQQE